MRHRGKHPEPHVPMQLGIDQHGIVGDLRTTALVGTDASVVSLCLPDADSPSVFAALLDPDRGGHLGCVITDLPADVEISCRQHYISATNMLITRLMADSAIVEILDFMVPAHLAGDREGVLVRRITAMHGSRALRLSCWPGFDYARAGHTATADEDGRRITFDSGETGALTLFGSGSWQLRDRERGPEAITEFELSPDQSATVVLAWGRDVTPIDDLEAFASEAGSRTSAFWQRWIDGCSYQGRWRDAVHRSALCLRLLQHEPTGGIVAAPTFSLPEWPGQGRNWDYRYVWLRDAAFVVFAMMRIGFTAEAEAFATWLSDRCTDILEGQGLHPVYRLDGSAPPAEESLDHLAGFAASTPVRIGNAAYGQVQLDVLGEVMDALYLYDRVAPISWTLWTSLGVQLDWLAEHWRDPDAGIWEMRGPRQQFVSSKLLVWVAFERAVRLSRRRGLPGDRDRWQREADAAYRWVQDNGYDEDLGSYVQREGSSDLDASLLLVPMLRFAGGNDPRVLATLDRLHAELATDSLMYRYSPVPQDAAPADDQEQSAAGVAPHLDGVGGAEGTFTLCTFWYVEGLARAGRLDDARRAFEKILTYANPLGLFSEQIGPGGQSLGNFPQALTHLALISAATTLDRALDDRRG